MKLRAMTDVPEPPSADKPLRLLNVASSVNPAAGGVSESILRISGVLIGLGHEVETVTVDDPASPWAKTLRVPVHLEGPPRGPLEASADFDQWLVENTGRFDAIISHGVWRHNSGAARKAALAARKPYFVFPHGMLDPWFMRYYPVKHLKKMAYWWMTEGAVLRDAAAVLFTCEEEKLLARKGGFWPYRCTERVVPLGTSEPPADNQRQLAAFAETFPQLANKRVILFLGRLHVKKGCDLLLQAFLKLLRATPPETWRDLHLMMAGPSSTPEYQQTLLDLARECEAISPGSVSFPGMISGDLKWGVLRRAEVFVLPSHQENFGIAVVEALGCGTPVLITKPVNIWREIETSGAGLVEDDTVDGCQRLLTRWLELTGEQRAKMKSLAVESFKKNFEISQTAHSLLATIRTLLP